MRARLHLALWIAAPLLPASAAPQDPPADGAITITCVDGRRLAAESVLYRGEDQLRLVDERDAAAVERTMPLADVVQLRTDVDPQPEPSNDVAVRLTDDSRLFGVLGKDAGGAAGDLLVLAHPSLGTLRLPLDVVAAATFGAAAERLDPADLARGEEEDMVVRRGGGTGDALHGTITRIDAAGIAIEGALGVVEFAPGDVAGLSLAAWAEPEPAEGAAGPRVAVELRTGGTLRGTLLEIGVDRVALGTAFAERVEVPLDVMLGMRFDNDRVTWLDTLEPVEVVEAPFIGGADDFLFPWQAGRTVTGGPLAVAGRRFGAGLGLHSHARLTYDLGGKYARFEAFAGVADEAAALDVEAALVVRVLVDGEVAFESPLLRAGEPAVPVRDVDLRGAERLTIEVDFGDGVDVGDRAVLGDPLLLEAAD